MANIKDRASANPFLTYGYAGPEYFCDRKQETADLLSALRNGRNVTLTAPRRMGKTGLIKNAFHRIGLEDDGVACIYLDIFPTRNLHDFIQMFGKAVIEGLQTTDEMVLSKITQLLTHCRPTLSVDPMTGTPSLSLNVVPTYEEQTLDEIFAYIASSGRRCYISIDEFQQITQYPEQQTEALLRSHIQFAKNASFIFSGSRRHLMSEMFLSAKRPFYQSTQLMELRPIDRDVYYNFAESFFARRGGYIDKDAFGTIYMKFNGQTWYVQAVLNRLYERFHDVDTVEIVDGTIAMLVEENTPAYQTLASLLPDKQLELMKAIAADDIVAAPTNGDFIRRHNLKAASSVSSALKALADKELIYKTERGYMVYDRLMSLWLRGL